MFRRSLAALIRGSGVLFTLRKQSDSYSCMPTTTTAAPTTAFTTATAATTILDIVRAQHF